MLSQTSTKEPSTRASSAKGRASAFFAGRASIAGDRRDGGPQPKPFRSDSAPERGVIAASAGQGKRRPNQLVQAQRNLRKPCDAAS